jgi:hypothetical protein
LSWLCKRAINVSFRRFHVLFYSVDWVWNVMAHAQKPDFVFRRNGRVHLNRRGRQFSRLMTAEVCASAIVMLVTPFSEVMWRVLATHSIRQYPLHFPSRASPCAITFKLDSTAKESGLQGCEAATFTEWFLTCRRSAFIFKHRVSCTFLDGPLDPPQGRRVKVGLHNRKSPLWNLQVHCRVHKSYETWRYIYVFTTTYYETDLWLTRSLI